VTWRWPRWCKKKLLVELEQAAEVRRLAAALAARQTPDFEAWESLLLQAARQGGAGVLGALLSHWQQHAPREAILCRCGQHMSSRGRRRKGLLTTLGRVPFARSFYICELCSQRRFPDDERLDIMQTTYSPGVRRLMARAGSQSQFKQAAEDLRCYAGLSVEPREVERVAEEVGQQVEHWLAKEQQQILQALCTPASPAAASRAKFYISFDGTGVPMRTRELLGRRGKQADGSARTREAKLGCVFTQVGLDRKGRPQRDPDSTTYVGAIEPSTLFGWRIYAEALRRGLEQAQTVLVLTDGARYNHTIVQTHFPQAVHIVDLFHAYEHLTAIAQTLWGPEAKAPKSWRDWLEAGDIRRLLRQIGKRLPTSGQSKKSMLKQLGYFENNAPQMRYAEYREKKFFVGSGVVEAGCRTVIGERLKQSGMRWSVHGANAIIALRCCILSRRFEDFWASRAP
jgi:transposase-like protein